MLNLVRYNATALYQDGSSEVECSGREAYLQRYAPAFNQVAVAEGVTGIKVLFLGQVMGLLVGPSNDQWDEMVMVEYPDFQAFRKVTESPQYETEATPHRRAALADWRLIAVNKIDLPASS
nr:DUF1330 domain-containing protein [Granulicella aggregans]